MADGTKKNDRSTTKNERSTKGERSQRPPMPEPLRAPVVDSHCHLDAVRQGTEPLPVEEALRKAAEVGVPRIVQIGCDLASARWTAEAVQRYDALLGGVALHPSEIPALVERQELDDALAEIDRLAGSGPRIRAIGETGLDYYWTGPEGRPAQQEAFRAHIEMAKRHGLALVIHDREAHADVLDILEDAGAPDRVVLHCFSGDREMAEVCVERGYYLSFAGTVTFKNAASLREAASVVPLSRMLVETDAPYLTPAPYRGRPNASYLVPFTVRCLADIKGVAEESLCAALSETSQAVFGSW